MIAASVASTGMSFPVASAAVTISMTSAGMALAMLMVVMAASYVRIVLECIFDECRNSLISRTAHTAEKLNASLAKRHLSTAADSAADQCVRCPLCQQPVSR